jgi:hypothetical protein
MASGMHKTHKTTHYCQLSVQGCASDISLNLLEGRMASSGMLRRVAIVITDVSEELHASFIRVTRIGELGKLAVTSNRRTQRASVTSYR